MRNICTIREVMVDFVVETFYFLFLQIKGTFYPQDVFHQKGAKGEHVRVGNPVRRLYAELGKDEETERLTDCSYMHIHYMYVAQSSSCLTD